jgi:hypothetical protein
MTGSLVGPLEVLQKYIKSSLKLNTKDRGASLGPSSAVSLGAAAWKGGSSTEPSTWIVEAQVDEVRRQMHAVRWRMGGVRDTLKRAVNSMLRSSL